MGKKFEKLLAKNGIKIIDEKTSKKQSSGVISVKSITPKNEDKNPPTDEYHLCQ